MTGNRPRVVLFVDESAASQEAQKAFEDVDAELLIMQATGPTVPSAKLGNAVYSGKWGIEFLLHGLPKRPTVQL